MCFIHMYVVAAAVCFIGSVHSSLTKFQCSDSRCFSSTYLCDGIPDCDDQSDEKHCAGCDTNMFKCQNSNCIRAMYACNGKDDCGDGSDELICGTCMFGCQDSRLVPADEVCDGFDDCGDGSDELNCGVASTAKKPPPSTSTATATPSTASSTSTATATPSTASSTVDQPSVIVEGQCNQTDGTYIHAKTTVAVHCDFRSNTFANLSVSCSRKGTEMSKSDRISYETGRQHRNPGLFYVKFQFTPVLRRDRGNYSCKATAGQSSKAISVSLLVYKVPAVTLSPSTLSLQEGDQRNFTCQVNNAPAVKTVPRSLVWCQANQVVTDQSKIVRVRDGMEILMMNSSDRAGVYKCGVINCTKTATLVITKPEVIVEGQCNQTDGTYIHGKTTVAVHCDFISNTFANLFVSCLRKGTEMSKSDRIAYETGRQRRNPRLFYAQFQFTPVLRRDRGNYSCKATAGQSAKAIAVSLLVYEIPTVTLSPSTLSLQEGDQRNFTCQVNNAPAVKTVPGSLVWCQANQVVTDQSKIVRVRDGMEILMMNSSDRAGVYKCGVINCTKTATLVITKPEVIVAGQCNQTDGTYIHGKTTVAVHCDFISNTFANLSVSCLRKGTEMSKSDRISYETGRQRRNPRLFYAQFQFTPVLRRDRGNYSCKATAGQSAKAIAVSLLVYEIPTVTLSPSTLSLQEGDQRNFTCQVNNAPAVKTVPGSLVWCQADQVVTDQSKIVRVRDGMEILMMNSSDRAGVYKCGVINCTKTATLVIIKPEVIVEGQCNQTDGTYIHGKTTVAVHCDFRSNTFANLSVSCLRKGTEMSKSDRISYETGRQRRNPRLFYAQFQFTPVLRRDRGNYSCKATAGQSAKAIAVSLLVYEIPTVTLSPSTLSLQEGDQRNFTCQVNNAPAVKTVPGSLVWCQADQVVTDQSKIVRVRDGMEILMMNSSDRAGVYKCGVINCTKTATLVIIKPEDKACTETTDTRGTVWPQTVSNTTMVLPCPGGFLGKVHRVCDVTGEWGEPNYINCVREEIAQIEEEVAAITEGTVSIEAVKNVLENLQKATENNDSSAGDLDKSIDIVDNIVAAVSGAASSVAVDTASVKSFVNVIDNILSVDTSKQDWQQVQKKNSTKAASLARSVTAFGLAAAESQTVNEPLKLNSSTMVMEIAKVTGRDIAFPSQGMEEVKSSLRLSKENFNNTAKITYVAASYKTMAEFLLTNTSGEETSTKEVNSQILSLAVNIGGKKLSNLKMKIYLDFHHLQGNYSESECGYWDFDKSRWLTDGCTGKDVNSSYTSCECNHLTNFAILMSPGRHVSAKHLHHLKIISIVGCSLSILGCVVTVLTHALLWSHVRSSKTIILMNLCVALTLAYSVFLAGVERTENKAVCTSVAAMLHYFFLAVFSLMLAQGIDIAVQVAVVFRKSSRLGLVLPLAWGVPAVIVGISLGITKLEGYGNDQFCWLTVTDGILFAFVGPALFVVLANAVIIAIIFRVLCSTRMMANKIKKDKIVTTVRSLCVLMPVLGVTWVFGVLAISEETVVFQYLFAVFNSLQGFLIFIMHCGLNRAIIEGIRETIARYESQITMSKSLPNSRNTDQSEERRAEKEQTCTDIPTGCNSDDLVSPTMVESTLRNVEASQKSVSNDDASPSSLIKEG